MARDWDTKVENALLRRAVGYEYTETRVEESDKGSKVIEITKHLPPDTKAAIFWLKNRQPGRWSDRQILEHEDYTEIDEAMEALSTEELLRLVYGDA